MDYRVTQNFLFDEVKVSLEMTLHDWRKLRKSKCWKQIERFPLVKQKEHAQKFHQGKK